MSKIMMYKELGGVNWCLCKIIAEHGDKIWINNLHTGTTPVKNKASIQFKEADEHIKQLTKPN